MTKFRFVFFVVLFLSSVSAWSVSSLKVPTSDPIYDIIDLAVSYQWIEPPISGVKPYSQREIDQLLESILPHISENPRLENFIEQYRRRFKKNQKNLDVQLLRSVRLEAAYTDTNGYSYVDNGLNVLNARVQPFSEYRQGRSFVHGAQFQIETSHSAQLGPYMAAFVSPHFYIQYPDNSTSSGEHRIDASLTEAYARFVWKNMALQLGRSVLQLGQGKNGGILLSNHARALDGIQLSNDIPFELPWFFKYLGKNRMLFHIASLGPEANFKHSLFSGLKWQMKPHRNFELGFGYTTIFGGEGSPDGSFLTRVRDYLGFVPILSTTENLLSNRMVGLDARVHVPALRGSQFYLEFVLDDKTFASLERTLIHTAAYKVGYYLPRLDADGKFDLRFEFNYLSEVMYRHGRFPYLLNNHILGHPLGSDGMRFDLSSRYQVSEKLRLINTLSLDRRDSDIYNNPGSSINRIADNPAATFWRYRFDAFTQVHPDYELNFSFAYQRAFNTGYVAGQNENQFLGLVGLKKHFH